jgi:hypothetical protein
VRDRPRTLTLKQSKAVLLVFVGCGVPEIAERLGLNHANTERLVSSAQVTETVEMFQEPDAQIVPLSLMTMGDRFEEAIKALEGIEGPTVKMLLALL